MFKPAGTGTSSLVILPEILASNKKSINYIKPVCHTSAFQEISPLMLYCVLSISRALSHMRIYKALEYPTHFVDKPTQLRNILPLFYLQNLTSIFSQQLVSTDKFTLQPQICKNLHVSVTTCCENFISFHFSGFQANCTSR